MPVNIPDHIQQLQSYKPGKPIDQIIKENELEEFAILWNNENPIGTSPKAQEKVIQALQGSYRYPDPLSMVLRKNIAKHVARDINEITVGNGGEGIMMNILKAFCEPGDELITSAGSFVIIYIWCRVNNIPCRQVPLKAGYQYDLDGIADAINDKTKIIYLATPNNPTGTAFKEKELKAFISKVPEHVLILIDEAYFEFAKAIDPNFPDSTQLDNQNILTLRSFSKAYGIASARLGYAIGPSYLIEPLQNVKLTFEPGGLAQAAGIGALDDQEFLQKVMENNKQGLSYLYQELDKLNIPFVRSLANFVMIDMGSAEKAATISQQLIDHGIFVRRLNGSGLPHCLRVSVGTEEENKLFIQHLAKLIET